MLKISSDCPVLGMNINALNTLTLRWHCIISIYFKYHEPFPLSLHVFLTDSALTLKTPIDHKWNVFFINEHGFYLALVPSLLHKLFFFSKK
jgi:hypothetical protein